MKHDLTRTLATILLLSHGAVVWAETATTDVDAIRQAAETLLGGKPATPTETPAPEIAEPAIPDTDAADKPLSEVITRQDENGNTITYVKVAMGDSLSAIAGRMYGDPDKYSLIYTANQELLHLESSDQIVAGTELLIPPLPDE